MAMLYDQFGREIQVEKKPDLREIAVTAVRDRWSQYPSKGLTPQKLAEIFQEADQGDAYRQAELFEEMEEKDAHLYSQFQTRKNAVLSFDYEIQPYSDSPEDKKIADMVEDTIYNLTSFEDALLDLLDAIGKGYSLEEIIWGIDGRFAIIQDLRWIHPKKAVFYEYQSTWQKSDEIPKVQTEIQPIRGEAMPPFKMIYHRYKARSGYDTRAGVLRVCGWMYLFKNYSIKDWVAFAEVCGMPLRLGKYEPGAGKNEKDALITAVQSLGTDAAGIISKNTEIEFVETTKGSGEKLIYDVLADFCDRQMSKAIVGQTATSEGTPGKLGSEEARENVRQDLVRADSEALSKTIRFQIFRPLVGYNFGWDKPLPWFKIMYEPSEDLRMLSEVYERLHRMNYPLSVGHIAERFKVPIPETGEAVLEKLAPPQFGFGTESRLTPTEKKAMKDYGDWTQLMAYRATARSDGSQKKIDDLISKILKDGGISEFRDSLEAIINQATTLEDLRTRILDRFKDVEITKMKEILTRAILIANLTGRVSV